MPLLPETSFTFWYGRRAIKERMTTRRGARLRVTPRATWFALFFLNVLYGIKSLEIGILSPDYCVVNTRRSEYNDHGAPLPGDQEPIQCDPSYSTT